VESIAWVAERRDVLSLFFGLLTLMAYVVYVQRTMAQRKAANRLGWYLLVCLGTLLAVMSKPTMVTLPCVMWLLDGWPLGRLGQAWTSWKRERRKAALLWLIVDKLPLLLIVTAGILLTVMAQSHTLTATELLPWSQRLVGVPLGYMAYLKWLIWPVDIAPLYPVRFDWTIGAVVLAIALLLGMSYLAVRSVRRAPWLLTGWLWFVGTMLPMIGLVHVGHQAYASRYAYLPFVGLYVMIAWSAGWLLEHLTSRRARWLVYGGVACVLLLLLAGSWRQTRIWNGSVALYWSFPEPEDPANPMTTSYTEHLIQQGQYHQAKRLLHRAAAYSLANTQSSLSALARIALIEHHLDRAHDLCTLALRANLGGANTWICLAEIALERHQPQLARSDLEQGLKAYPHVPQMRHAAGQLYDQLGLVQQAQQQYEQAMKLAPDNADIICDAGLFMFRHGQYESAAKLLGQISSRRVSTPAGTVWYTLGVSLSRTGRPEQAEAAYRQALALKPHWSAALNSLGIVLAQMSRLDEAHQSFEQAVQADPTNSQAKANLARLHSRTQPTTHPATRP
jgi:Tfp pilus assembly protein PilF